MHDSPAQHTDVLTFGRALLFILLLRLSLVWNVVMHSSALGNGLIDMRCLFRSSPIEEER